MISKKHDKLIAKIKDKKSFSIWWNNMLGCYKITDNKNDNKTIGYDWSDLDEVLSFVRSAVEF